MTRTRTAPGVLRTSGAASSSLTAPKRRLRRPFVPTEHASQSAFFAWWGFYARSHGIPDHLCFAVPNAGKMSYGAARWMAAEGRKQGVADVILLMPSGGFHALLMEFKRPGNKPTEAQAQFLYDVRRRGYNAMVVYSTEEAVKVVKAYLMG